MICHCSRSRIDAFGRWLTSERLTTWAYGISLVLKNLLPLHGDVLRGFHVDLARAIDGDVLAFDSDRAIFLHGDTGITCRESDGICSGDGKVLSTLSVSSLPTVALRLPPTSDD